MKKRIPVSYKMRYNQLLTNYHYSQRHLRLSNVPMIYDIELTNYCNLDCPMCPRRHMTRPIGYMDMGLFRRIIDQAREYTDHAWLHLFGEALFHPHLEEAINYCADAGVWPAISTNATVLNEERSRVLLRSKLKHIKLSFDGACAATYEKVRKGAQFEAVRENIRMFLEMKKQCNNTHLCAEVQIISMHETIPEIEEFKRQWEGLADCIYVKNFARWADQCEEIPVLANGEKVSCMQKQRYPCEYLWKDGVVLWNGDVVPCCYDFDGKAVFGNLKKQTLLEIWNSSRIRELRSQHRENNFSNPLCAKCNEWVGKPADRFYPFSRFYPQAKAFCKKWGTLFLKKAFRYLLKMCCSSYEEGGRRFEEL